MFGIAVKSTFNAKPVQKAADKAAFKNFGHAAASIRKTAVASIVRAKGPSPAGSPPHTRRGLLKRAIRFFADKDGAVIGPMHSIAGEAGKAHEFGGPYKSADYPERPFMFPALKSQVDRFAGSWRGSIGT